MWFKWKGVAVTSDLLMNINTGQHKYCGQLFVRSGVPKVSESSFENTLSETFLLQSRKL